MSYILEALRKAERERNVGQVPSIELGASKTAEAPRRGWPWLLAAALLVNAAVLAVWIGLPKQSAPPAVVATGPDPSTPPSPASLPEPAVSDYLPPPTTISNDPFSEPPVVAYTEPAPEPAREEFQPAPEPVAVESYTEEAYVEETYEEVPIEETPLAEEPTLLKDMPADYRRSVPAMKIDAHFYTDVPGRSFVMINLNKYRTGERMSEGPQVVDIVERGVILSYQGREFLLTP